MRIEHNAEGTYAVSHGICNSCYREEIPEDDDPKFQTDNRLRCPKCNQYMLIATHREFEDENLTMEEEDPKHKNCPDQDES